MHSTINASRHGWNEWRRWQGYFETLHIEYWCCWRPVQVTFPSFIPCKIQDSTFWQPWKQDNDNVTGLDVRSSKWKASSFASPCLHHPTLRQAPGNVWKTWPSSILIPSLYSYPKITSSGSVWFRSACVGISSVSSRSGFWLFLSRAFCLGVFLLPLPGR